MPATDAGTFTLDERKLNKDITVGVHLVRMPVPIRWFGMLLVYAGCWVLGIGRVEWEEIR